MASDGARVWNMGTESVPNRGREQGQEYNRKSIRISMDSFDHEMEPIGVPTQMYTPIFEEVLVRSNGCKHKQVSLLLSFATEISQSKSATRSIHPSIVRSVCPLAKKKSGRCHNQQPLSTGQCAPRTGAESFILRGP